MSVKKLSFYLDTAQIMLCSNHLPLKKFLEKNTMNAKVNNWTVELESQNIKFEFISGVKNVLADTLSRLIEMDDDVKQPKEGPGHEFGYTPFEELPPAIVAVIEEAITLENGEKQLLLINEDPSENYMPVELPLTDLRMKELQEQDPLVGRLIKLWSSNKLNKNIFMMERDLLKKKLIINGIWYTPTIVPDILKDCLLVLAHNKQGHNGFRRTHNAL